ncbi:hypothetical protein GH733_000711 [Mirounga leonina]|nr:hypothetical protein GH733_000711 [Mirounga leonina]
MLEVSMRQRWCDTGILAKAPRNSKSCPYLISRPQEAPTDEAKRGNVHFLTETVVSCSNMEFQREGMRTRRLPLHIQIFYCARPDQEPFVKIITVEEAKRRKSTCSYYEDDDEVALPILQPHSALLENMHIEQLARRLPARVQGYPWRLAYSTLEHGTSLKTLYRKSASLDSPVFKWSGENSYFINGDISSLELGGGGGRFGLWLDADLYHGRSNSCSTFNNDILSKKEDFIVQDLELSERTSSIPSRFHLAGR